jgi:ferredoxin
MSFTAQVDPSLCEGHGQCLIAAPGLFDADEDGYSHVAIDPLSDDLRDSAERAMRACPAGAITIAALRPAP